MAVNERDGGGKVSITAGLVLNELHMYLLSLLGRACVCVCIYAGVCIHAGVCMHACCCTAHAQTLQVLDN